MPLRLLLPPSLFLHGFYSRALSAHIASPLGIPKQRRPLKSVFSPLLSQLATTILRASTAARIEIKQQRRLSVRVRVFLSVQDDDDMLNKAKLARAVHPSAASSAATAVNAVR